MGRQRKSRGRLTSMMCLARNKGEVGGEEEQLQGCRYIRRREDGKTEEEQGEIDLDDVFGKK